MLTRRERTPLRKLMLLGAMAGAGALVEDTATGNPLTFITDISKPLKSILVPFTPVQSGSGDPSPQNVRPLVPWEGLNVFGGGKNLFNKETVSTGVWWKGTVLTGGQYKDYKASDKIPVLPNVRYVLTRQSPQQGAVCYFDKNKQYVDQQTWDRYTPSRIIPDGVYYIAFTVEAEYINSAQFEVGQTATAYEPYRPITETSIPFASTVYGGTLDVVSGVLTVEWVLMSKKWSQWEFGEALTNVTRKTLTLPQQQELYVQRYEANSITNFTNVYLNSNSSDTVHYYINQRGNVLYAFLPNDFDGETVVQISAKLITPYEVQLTPQQLTALLGNNTIWSDADGQMTAVYLRKK